MLQGLCLIKAQIKVKEVLATVEVLNSMDSKVGRMGGLPNARRGVLRSLCFNHSLLDELSDK